MAFDPYKEAQNINLDNLDEDGNDIAKMHREQEKQENKQKDKEDDISRKLRIIRNQIDAGMFDAANAALDKIVRDETERVGFFENALLYHYKTLLDYGAKNDEELVSILIKNGQDVTQNQYYRFAKNTAEDNGDKTELAKLQDIADRAARRTAAAKADEEKPDDEKTKPAQNSGEADEAVKKKLRRVSRLIDAGDFEEAKERLEKIEQDEIDRTDDCVIPQVYHYKMLLDYKARTDDELIATLIEKQDDITQNKNYRLAKSCAEDADDDDEFDTLLDIKKKAADGIAKAKAEAEARARAEAERKAEEERQQKIASLTQQADEAYKNKKYQNAIDLYNQAVQLGATNLQPKIKQAKKEEEAEAERKNKAEEERKRLSGDFYNLGNGYITFGTYPQSIKAGTVQIGKISDKERSYYLGSDNCLYEKYKNEFYKVQPIKWKVLTSGNEYFIVSELIIDVHRFDETSDNYTKSEIRNWLNGEFYNKAFNNSQKEKIVTTTIDNSLSSTGYSSNRNTCGNTKDKIFLLSHKEAQQYFDSDSSRQKKGTDYTNARKLQVFSNGYSYWWLRSPDYYDSYSAQYILSGGGFSQRQVSQRNIGVLCALKIKP